MVAKHPDIIPYAVGLARAYCAVNDVGAAGDVARSFGDKLQHLPDNAFLLQSIQVLSEVACILGDVNLCNALYQRGEKFREQNIIVSWAASCDGAVAQCLGMLATALEKWDEAEADFELARRRNSDLNAAPLIARGDLYEAQMLVRRGRARDRERAKRLLGGAFETFERLGAKGYLDEAEDLSRYLTASSWKGVSGDDADVVGRARSLSDDVATEPAVIGVGVAEGEGVADGGENVFRLEGDYWTLVFGGRVSRFRDKRGLRYLAYLLAHPYKEIHSMDLATAVGARSEPSGAAKIARSLAAEGQLRRGRLGDVGPVLDARARSDCRRRLAELRQELAEAEEFNDLGRVALIRGEIEQLGSYLSAAARSGGGSRVVGSYTERARVSVRNNIATAVRMIRDHDATLGRHLDNTVHTGTFCSYVPERKISWRF
jgi:hypothetical protein